MRGTTGEGCASAEECLAESVCYRSVHPFTGPLVAVSLAAVAAAWWGRRVVLLALAMPTLALGMLAGLSLGLYGVGVGALVLAAGAATTPSGTRRSRDTWLLVAAWGVLACDVLVVGSFAWFGARGAGAIYVALLGPAAAWFALWGIMAAVGRPAA